MYEIEKLRSKKINDLQEIAKTLKIKVSKNLKKEDLIYKIIDHISSVPSDEKEKKPLNKKEDSTSPKTSDNNYKKDRSKNKRREEDSHNKDKRNRYRQPDFEFEGIIETEGVLDTMSEGYGFLRSSDFNYLSSPDDVYVSQSQIRLFGLKTGDTVHGTVRPPKEGEKYFPLIKVNKINGLDPKVVRDRVSFEHLTPLFPDEKFRLAEKNNTISTRIIDLFSPI